MANLEKVINGINRCTCHVPDACRDCGYDAGQPYNVCVESLLKDTLELLKTQEPVEPEKREWPYGVYGASKYEYKCGACGCCLVNNEKWQTKYCPECGRAVKWDG